MIVKYENFDLIRMEDARAHLRVGDDTSNDDRILLNLESAADIAESLTNRMIRGRRIIASFPLERTIYLKMTPVNAVEKMSYVNNEGEEIEVPLSSYTFIPDEYNSKIIFTELPTVDTINVSLNCGYRQDTLPPAIRAAILFILGNLYDNESDNLIGRSVSELPMSFSKILAPWRIDPY